MHAVARRLLGRQGLLHGLLDQGLRVGGGCGGWRLWDEGVARDIATRQGELAALHRDGIDAWRSTGPAPRVGLLMGDAQESAPCSPNSWGIREVGIQWAWRSLRGRCRAILSSWWCCPRQHQASGEGALRRGRAETGAYRRQSCAVLEQLLPLRRSDLPIESNSVCSSWRMACSCKRVSRRSRTQVRAATSRRKPLRAARVRSWPRTDARRQRVVRKQAAATDRAPESRPR